MLTGNLASRPFYNERLVRGVLIVALAAAAAWAAFNVVTVISLSQQSAMLGARVAGEGLRASGARSQAAQVRRSLNAAELEVVAAAAAEANALIERRTFSWTGLFNTLETTLPPDVRLVSIQPQADDGGRLMLALSVVSKRIEDLDAFIRALEATGTFSGVLSRSDEALEDGNIGSSLLGYYATPTKPAAATSEPTSAATPPVPAVEPRR